MSVRSVINAALDQGNGIMRLAPNWVPRSFCVPGRRMKLHPDDLYAFGGARGGIDERWFASATPADNGPLTSPNEGLSFLVFEDGGRTEKVLFRDAINELQAKLLGDRIWKKHQCWPMFAKFFDNQGPLPHHIHHREEHAKLTGQASKPEAYYFPPQINNHGGDFPCTFFGLNPGVTRDDVRKCLVDFSKGDNKITNLSKAHRLEIGTGWDVPPGVLHAPGSLCTYEPQKASDIFAMYQSLAGTTVVPEELLWKSTPADKMNDVEHLLDVIDWELNLDPDFVAHRFMRPKPVMPEAEMRAAGFIENWISYRSSEFSAKELTVLPGCTAHIRDSGAYGLIVMQGHGRLGEWDVEAPVLIRYGQLTSDEFFVSAEAAGNWVKIVNPSGTDPLVMLKHFGPGNPDLTLDL